MENGSGRNATRLVDVARSLHVSVDYLLSDSLSLPSGQQEQLLLQLFASATPQQQKLILETAKLILSQ